MVVDLSAFTTVEKDINYAGLQLQNARKTFGVGFFLSLVGGALATGGYFAKDPKVQTGLVVAGGVNDYGCNSDWRSREDSSRGSISKDLTSKG